MYVFLFMFCLKNTYFKALTGMYHCCVYMCMINSNTVILWPLPIPPEHAVSKVLLKHVLHSRTIGDFSLTKSSKVNSMCFKLLLKLYMFNITLYYHSEEEVTLTICSRSHFIGEGFNLAAVEKCLRKNSVHFVGDWLDAPDTQSY